MAVGERIERSCVKRDALHEAELAKRRCARNMVVVPLGKFEPGLPGPPDGMAGDIVRFWLNWAAKEFR
jgi:hypothetical protein